MLDRAIDGIILAVDWLQYLPRGARRAWCELTGGHNSVVLGAWAGGDRASHVQLYCQRCGKQTRWFDVPYSTIEERRKALAETESR